MSLIKLQQPPQHLDLGMISVILHTMAPDDRPIIEEKFAANLERVATANDVSLSDPIRILQTVIHCLELAHCPGSSANVTHILRSLRSNIQGWGHAELLEQFSRRFGVHGKRTICEGFVVGNQIRLSTSNHDDGCWDGNGEVVTHGDAVGESLQVCLTCTAVEVADKDDELSLMGRCGWIVKGAEWDGFPLGVVDGNVLHRSEGRTIRTVVGDQSSEIIIRAESCKPIVGRDDVDVVILRLSRIITRCHRGC